MKSKVLEPIFYNFNSSSGIEEGMSTIIHYMPKLIYDDHNHLVAIMYKGYPIIGVKPL